jgi:hypothetical protein
VPKANYTVLVHVIFALSAASGFVSTAIDASMRPLQLDHLEYQQAEAGEGNSHRSGWVAERTSLEVERIVLQHVSNIRVQVVRSLLFMGRLYPSSSESL